MKNIRRVKSNQELVGYKIVAVTSQGVSSVWRNDGKRIINGIMMADKPPTKRNTSGIYFSNDLFATDFAEACYEAKHLVNLGIISGARVVEVVAIPPVYIYDNDVCRSAGVKIIKHLFNLNTFRPRRKNENLV